MEIRTTPKPQVAAATPKVRTTQVSVALGASKFVPGTRPAGVDNMEKAVERRPSQLAHSTIGETVGTQLNTEVARQKRIDRAKFAGVIGSAKKALIRARAQSSTTTVELAVDEICERLGEAVKLDAKRRSRSELVAFIGSDWSELDRLLLKVYMTVTVVPDSLLGSVTVPQCRYRLHKDGPPREVNGHISLNGSDNKIEVVRLKGKRPTSIPEPIRQISSSEPVDPPKARIIYRDGDHYGSGPLLELPDDRHAFMGEIDGKPERLMGAGHVAYMKCVDGVWVYYPYATDRKHCSDVPLIGSFRRRFIDPSQLKCDYDPIKIPLFTFIYEVRGKIQAQLIGLNELGLVKSVEVPWSDDLVAEEFVEITHGFSTVQ
ncbi:hypothetical protein HYV69_00630 [Candidatus Uhrbacteria bacterium]|nr:hypothetical protein [Candidatus Uhrbacteria bacterium]